MDNRKTSGSLKMATPIFSLVGRGTTLLLIPPRPLTNRALLFFDKKKGLRCHVSDQVDEKKESQTQVTLQSFSLSFCQQFDKKAIGNPLGQSVVQRGCL